MRGHLHLLRFSCHGISKLYPVTFLLVCFFVQFFFHPTNSKRCSFHFYPMFKPFPWNLFHFFCVISVSVYIAKMRTSTCMSSWFNGHLPSLFVYFFLFILCSPFLFNFFLQLDLRFSQQKYVGVLISLWLFITCWRVACNRTKIILLG
jgi:hypothetical protein